MNNLNTYIHSQIKKNMDDYDFSLKKYYNKLLTYQKYRNLFLFIIYKNNKLYSILNDGDARKKLIIKIVKNIINNMKKKHILPNFFIPFYVSDTHFYLDNDMFFFVEAKPRNKKGILYPDQNYYNIKIKNNMVNYDKFKKILEKKCSSLPNKKPIIYFSGANTGSDKHNIRIKLKEIVEYHKNRTYNINIDERYVPMYDFCNYKYLLNLPGHQPWSYRMTKILLMKSLIFDVSIYQSYVYKINNKKIIDNNDKWVQFYSDYFKEGEDYIQINYNWLANVTPDSNVNNIYKECNKLFKKFEKNTDEYKKITKNAYLKANQLNMSVFNDTFEKIISCFIKKLYKANSVNDIDNFIDKILLFDEEISINI